jgi:hypothetical protein
MLVVVLMRLSITGPEQRGGRARSAPPRAQRPAARGLADQHGAAKVIAAFEALSDRLPLALISFCRGRRGRA